MATAVDGERFDLGRVAARTFGVIGRNPVLFIGVALLFSGLPTLALGFVGVGEERFGDTPNGALLQTGFSGLLYFLLASLMQTSLVVATLQDLSGQRVDFAACIRRAFLLFLPLIGLSIVMAFGLMLGFVLLIVPGVILYLMWFVAAPALVEERRGIFAALGRSRALTAGARWSIFGLVIAFLILSGLVALAQRLLISFALGETIGIVIGALTSTLTSLIASTGVAATYVELRTVKEGTGVDALAEIFA